MARADRLGLQETITLFYRYGMCDESIFHVFQPEQEGFLVILNNY